MKPMNRRFAVVVIIAGIPIGLLLQFMVWRIQDIGVDWISALLGLIAVGVLFMAGMVFHHEICHVQRPE
jgi:Cu/Ag efflux pump CusA